MAGFSHLGRCVRICNRSSQLEIWKVFYEVHISAFCQSCTRRAKFPCSAALPWVLLQLVSWPVTCWKLRFQISSLVQCLAHRKLYSDSYLSRHTHTHTHIYIYIYIYIYILKLRFYYKIISRFHSCWNSNEYTTDIAYLISDISQLIRMLLQLKLLSLSSFFSIPAIFLITLH